MAPPLLGSRPVQFGAAGMAVLAVAAVVAIVLVRRGNSRTIAPPAATGSAQLVDYTLKSSLLALVHSADLICACTVLSSAPPYTATPRVDGTGIGPAPQGVAVQDFSVRVDRVLSNKTAPEKAITITQAGSGADPGEAKENPPLTVGSHYVLFLRQAANGKYGLVSGPQGLMLLDAQNRLQPVLTDDPVTSVLRNRKLDQLIGLLGITPPTPTR